jgi:hypothetical protein
MVLGYPHFRKPPCVTPCVTHTLRQCWGCSHVRLNNRRCEGIMGIWWGYFPRNGNVIFVGVPSAFFGVLGPLASKLFVKMTQPLWGFRAVCIHILISWNSWNHWHPQQWMVPKSTTKRMVVVFLYVDISCTYFIYSIYSWKIMGCLPFFFNHVLPPKKSPAEIGLEPKAQFSRRLNDAGTPWPRRRSDSLGMASVNYPI